MKIYILIMLCVITLALGVELFTQTKRDKAFPLTLILFLLMILAIVFQSILICS